MSDFADQIAALSPEKRALLAQRNPLSFAQERLWFLNRLAPDSAAYIVPMAVRLEGRIDAAALARSLSAIVARHDVLRTIFPAIDGQPMQAVAPSLRLPLPLIDIGGVAAPAREATIERLIRAEARIPFDLARGPLVRARLLRAHAADHVLLLTLHHIVADGWSIDVLLRELTALYQAFAQGRPDPLPDLPIQYADYAAWQRDWLRDGADSPLQGQLAYWRARLDGAPAVLALPTDHPRSMVQSFQGATHPFRLPDDLAAGLRALSQRSGATLFMLLLAAWQTLLYRYSGQDDIVVGAPVANRADAEVEGLIGCFVNTLIMRGDLSGDPPFAELVRRVRETTLEAYAHQDLPFERLVAALQPQRTLSHAPLFQTLFLLQHARPAVATGGLTLRPLVVETDAAELDLVLMMYDGAAGLGGGLKYRTDLFEAATIARWLGHFQTLLSGIVADPAARIADLPLLGSAERRQLLADWNATEAPLPPDARVDRMFERQAEHTPDVVAIVFDSDEKRRTQDEVADSASVVGPSARVHLSYAALNRRANQLAHRLRALGLGADALAGIYLERSPELFVALLGVLKAGAAYLPLDPSYPAERLAFMVEDANAHAIICNVHSTIDDLDAKIQHATSNIVNLAADWPALAAMPAHNPQRDESGDNLAYVIYTSGSTGRPKGAMIVRRALANHARAMAELYELGAGGRVMHFFSVSFDAAAEDIFPPLLSGATVICPRNPLLWAPAELLSFCDRQRISILHLPAAYWQALVAWLPDRLDAVPGSLRVVTAGGERIMADALRRWAARSGPATLFRNVYGPTETTITSVVYAPSSYDELLADVANIPIGRPIANTTIYLLDRRMRPVPIGVAGELHIGGSGLARGYLGAPDLTAERFVPNPFVKGSGVRDQGSDPDPRPPTPDPRLYRTGDLARYRADGMIEFLGRIDGQIKLRGYRIEPGEIAATLAAHPGVRETAVVLRGERLIAYVVTRDEFGGTSNAQPDAVADSSRVTHHASLAAELREWLAARLPAYMLPAAFVALDALPLTPNGKLDLRALPAPDGARPESQASFVAPQTDLELRIAAIWQALLGIDRVGAHDNFFDLGGHSLLLIQMQSQLREELGRDLPLAELFQYPTIESLARHIYEGRDDAPAAQQTQERADARLDRMSQQRRFRQQSRATQKTPR